MGRPKLVRTEKLCPRCRQTLPLDAFYARPNGGPDCYCRPCRKDYQRRLAARKAGHRRHVRINARGDVWCNHCQRYLPTCSFRRHPSRPHTWWAYCVDCTRELDRLRWRGERRARHNAESPNRRRRRRASERSERRAFVAGAILTLRRRGLTKTDVSRLTGVSLGSILAAEQGGGRWGPTPHTAARFVVALRATAHLPTGAEPAYRRRLPLPGLAELVARVRPLMDAYPVRSRWRGRDAEEGTGHPLGAVPDVSEAFAKRQKEEEGTP